MVVSVLMVPLLEFAIARNVFPAKVIGSPVCVCRMPRFGRLTPGISGGRRFNVHESDAYARVRCMPLLDAAFAVTALATANAY